jgi:phosphoglycerol transferase MdoB-like AlkP superfamily enzyme
MTKTMTKNIILLIGGFVVVADFQNQNSVGFVNAQAAIAIMIVNKLLRSYITASSLWALLVIIAINVVSSACDSDEELLLFIQLSNSYLISRANKLPTSLLLLLVFVGSTAVTCTNHAHYCWIVQLQLSVSFLLHTCFFVGGVVLFLIRTNRL